MSLVYIIQSFTNVLIQRFQTYQVQTEVYHTSEKDQEVRKEMTFCVNPRLDFQSSTKFARMFTNLTLWPERGEGRSVQNVARWNPHPCLNDGVGVCHPDRHPERGQVKSPGE